MTVIRDRLVQLNAPRTVLDYMDHNGLKTLDIQPKDFDPDCPMHVELSQAWAWLSTRGLAGEAVFNGTGLQGRQFESYSMYRPEFNSTDLRNTKWISPCFLGGQLQHSNLDRANVRNGLFRECHFLETSMKGVKVTNSSFPRTSLERVKAKGSRWRHCDLDKAQISDCMFERASFSDCSFDEAHVGECWGRGVEMKDCTFRRANLQHFFFYEADLENVSFRYADLQKADFRKSKLFDCNFNGADLRGAVFEGAQFRRCTFLGAKLPDFGGILRPWANVNECNEFASASPAFDEYERLTCDRELTIERAGETGYIVVIKDAPRYVSHSPGGSMWYSHQPDPYIGFYGDKEEMLIAAMVLNGTANDSERRAQGHQFRVLHYPEQKKYRLYSPRNSGSRMVRISEENARLLAKNIEDFFESQPEQGGH